MTAVALPAQSPHTRSSLAVLGAVEAKRFARHPLFLAGFGWALWLTASSSGPGQGNLLDYPVVPAFFVGVLGLIVAARLTWSTLRSREVLDGAPLSVTTRTAALCLACLVPCLAGLVLTALELAMLWLTPQEDWVYGTFTGTDRFVILVLAPAVMCLGGPLLGVALARWVHFPGAALLTAIVVVVGSGLLGYVPMQNMDRSSVLARILHMVPPHTSMISFNGADSGRPRMVSYTGSPGWYLVWIIALAGLALLAALWRGSTGTARTRIGRSVVVLALLAPPALVLAGLGGNAEPMASTPDGRTAVASDADMRQE